MGCLSRGVDPHRRSAGEWFWRAGRCGELETGASRRLTARSNYPPHEPTAQRQRTARSRAVWRAELNARPFGGSHDDGRIRLIKTGFGRVSRGTAEAKIAAPMRKNQHHPNSHRGSHNRFEKYSGRVAPVNGRSRRVDGRSGETGCCYTGTTVLVLPFAASWL